MKYNFTDHIERHGRDAIAVDGIGHVVWGFEPEHAKPGFDEIPMWVADMNFATCPAVTRAMTERISHPLFGYFKPSEEYYDSIIRWQTERHGYADLKREEIGYENGVHGGVCTAIEVFTEPGDAILIHIPAYVGFLGDIRQLGRRASMSPLKKDPEGIWRMDYEDMERRIVEDNIRLVIFCSPHNPTGRVWEREELEMAMDVFSRHDCVVVSDEIWSDVLLEGSRHIPMLTVGREAEERTITLCAPSKTFNLAGLIGSYHIIRNPELRGKMRRHSAKTHYNEMNVLSMHALIGAYSEEGAEWTDELLSVLSENCRTMTEFINGELDGCEAMMPQGSYMVFMDCRRYCERTGRSMEEILKAGWDVGVAYQDGRKCEDPYSIRINCALPADRLLEACERMKKYVFV